MVLVSSHSIEEMEKFVHDSDFSKILNKNLNKYDLSQFGLPFDKANVGHMFKV